jgi:hypothetical protein
VTAVGEASSTEGEVKITYIILIGGVIFRDNINMKPKETYFVCV